LFPLEGLSPETTQLSVQGLGSSFSRGIIAYVVDLSSPEASPRFRGSIFGRVLDEYAHMDLVQFPDECF